MAGTRRSPGVREAGTKTFVTAATYPLAPHVTHAASHRASRQGSIDQGCNRSSRDEVVSRSPHRRLSPSAGQAPQGARAQPRLAQIELDCKVGHMGRVGRRQRGVFPLQVTSSGNVLGRAGRFPRWSPRRGEVCDLGVTKSASRRRRVRRRLPRPTRPDRCTNADPHPVPRRAHRRASRHRAAQRYPRRDRPTPLTIPLPEGVDMIPFEHSMDIDRPINEVFSFLADFTNIPLGRASSALRRYPPRIRQADDARGHRSWTHPAARPLGARHRLPPDAPTPRHSSGALRCRCQPHRPQAAPGRGDRSTPRGMPDRPQRVGQTP